MGLRAESPPRDAPLVNPLVVYHLLKVSGKSGCKGLGTLNFREQRIESARPSQIKLEFESVSL